MLGLVGKGVVYVWCRMFSKVPETLSNYQPSEGKLSGAEFLSASSFGVSAFCFFSLIRLITLVKTAQSTKKATTPTIHTTNNSVTMFF